MWPNPQETADLVTYAEEILNGKFQFFCGALLRSFSILWKTSALTSILHPNSLISSPTLINTLFTSNNAILIISHKHIFLTLFNKKTP